MDGGGEGIGEPCGEHARMELRGAAGVENGLLDTTYTHERSCFLLVHRLHTGRVWSQATFRLRHGLQST